MVYNFRKDDSLILAYYNNEYVSVLRIIIKDESECHQGSPERAVNNPRYAFIRSGYRTMGRPFHSIRQLLSRHWGECTFRLISSFTNTKGVYFLCLKCLVKFVIVLKKLNKSLFMLLTLKSKWNGIHYEKFLKHSVLSSLKTLIVGKFLFKWIFNRN